MPHLPGYEGHLVISADHIAIVEFENDERILHGAQVISVLRNHHTHNER